MGARPRTARWRSSRSSSATAGASCTSCPIARRPRRGAREIALADAALARALIAALRDAAPLEAPEGRVEFELTSPLPPAAELAPVRAPGGEQSNSSLVLGERVILKAYRRLEPGREPRARAAALPRRARLRARAAAARLATAARAPAITATLGILQAFVAGAQDGWDSRSSRSPTRPFLGLRGSARHGRMHACSRRRSTPRSRPSRSRRRARARGPSDARAALASRTPAHAGLRGAGAASRGGGWRRSGSTATTTSARCCGPPATGWCSTSRASRPARCRSDAARARRCATSPACCARSPTRPRRAPARAGPGRRGGRRRRAQRSWPATRPSPATSCCPAAGPRAPACSRRCELEKALDELRYELDNRPGWAPVPAAGIARLLGGA